MTKSLWQRVSASTTLAPRLSILDGVPAGRRHAMNSLLASSAILRHERLLLSSLCTSMAEEYLSFQAETLHENLAGEE